MSAGPNARFMDYDRLCEVVEVTRGGLEASLEPGETP